MIGIRHAQVYALDVEISNVRIGSIVGNNLYRLNLWSDFRTLFQLMQRIACFLKGKLHQVFGGWSISNIIRPSMMCNELQAARPTAQEANSLFSVVGTHVCIKAIDWCIMLIGN